MRIEDFKSSDEVSWCPGCGNFGLLAAVKKALVELNRPPNQVLLVSGIGQAAKLPHYVRANCFNGLHGRALPAAAGARIANRELSVIVTTGDGDCYGEGGNHFIHNIRRNLDITVLVHNNQVYGLTKGQASPTTQEGVKTKVQPEGVILDPFQSLATAIAGGCGFVARGFVGQTDHLVWLICEGVKFRGFALIEVLQPCATYNKLNTFAWYTQRAYKVNDDPAYDVKDKAAALQKALEWGDRIPLGILYRSEGPSYEDKSNLNKLPPLVDQPVENIDVKPLLQDFF